MPGDPTGIGATCHVRGRSVHAMRSKISLQHKPKPTNTVPGITYMLAGATQRSDSDPYDTTSKPIAIGPHWMIMWPFDPKKTVGLCDRAQADGSLYHVGWLSVCSFAHHGASLTAETFHETYAE